MFLLFINKFIKKKKIKIFRKINELIHFISKIISKKVSSFKILLFFNNLLKFFNCLEKKKKR